MKTIRFGAGVLVCNTVLTISALAQGTASTSSLIPASAMVDGVLTERTVEPSASVALQDSSTISHLDQAVAALAKGDKSATTQELQAGITGMETAAQTKPTSFKDKLLSQASKLKTLLPLIPTGALGNGALGKAVNLAKLAVGGNQLESVLSAGSLLGKGSQLTSGLSSVGSALSGLGGGTQTAGKSLVSSALSAVGKLNQGGIAAQAAEPVVKTEVGSLLNFVKGAL